MTLTTSELRDLVAITLLTYLREERGETPHADECVKLINWVDAQDFEFRLETLRWDD